MSDAKREPARYGLLDAWRGVAALAVLGFHTVGRLFEINNNWLTTTMVHGWVGVFIFFPISGYCILAASHSSSNRRVAAFLKRRWRRIFPTYWASVAVAVGLTIACAPFSQGSVDELLKPGFKWLSILSLTQTFTGMSGAINPVYWSLCYEEQFYLLIALSMFFAEERRPVLFLALTVIATAVYCVPAAIHLPHGLFIDQWLSFAVGLAVFGWFDHRYGMRWSLSILALAIVAEVFSGRLDLGISIAAAVLFIALRRYDRYLCSIGPVALLAGVGTISYSLYLIHVPIAGRVVNGSIRFMRNPSPWWVAIAISSMALAIASAAVFYRLVEKRFQNARGAVVYPAAAEAAVA